MPSLSEPFVRQKLADLSQYLAEFETLAACDLATYQRDFVKRHAIEKLIELIVEVASDINRHILDVHNAVPPQTYYSTFEEMGNLGVLPASLAVSLAATTGLRNRLVHGYEKVQHEIVYHSLKSFLRNYKRYFVLMNDHLKSRMANNPV